MKPKAAVDLHPAPHREPPSLQTPGASRTTASHSPFTSTISRETLLRAIRSALKAAGRSRITQQHFLAASSLRKRDIFTHFATWQAALRAAGCHARPHNAPVPTAQLLDDWGNVAASLRRIPTVHEYHLHGHYTEGTFSHRFGSWSRVPTAFRAHAKKSSKSARKWKRVLKHIDSTPPRKRRLSRTRPAIRNRRMSAAAQSHPYPLPSRAASAPATLNPLSPLCFAPANEQGVIILFGKLAERLGFLILALQTPFPDCTALRRTPSGNWEIVTIEFEFESKNFCYHRHDPAGCDFIVCWEHNWPDCPENLKVIALREHVTALQLDSYGNGGGGRTQ